jgi:hypothetical protein|tara:strand:- start:268 stop:1044 length:777 start_codon:yes stop_codon:yes gene_type:complete
MKNKINERLDKEEYAQLYLGEYYNKTKMQSRTVDNFLSDSELDAFELASHSDDIYMIHDTSMSPLAEHLFQQDPSTHTTANYHIFEKFYDNPAWSNLVDIIQPKLEAEFSPDIRASHIHILDSWFPYGLHNDAEQPNMKIAPEPAWTLIIPLDTCDSTTYVFNERSGFKDPNLFARHYGIESHDLQTTGLTQAEFDEDFAPITDPANLSYLTVETKYKWKRGSCFAADRFKYHCSSNYLNKGIKHKRAIILWTSLKES